MKATPWMGAVIAAAALSAGAGEWTLDARQARIRTVGGAVADAWNLWSDGEVGDHVAVAAGGAFTFAITARGTPARGEWPRMAVRVDGSPLAETNVAGDVATYEFPLRLAAGDHRIVAAFLNDATGPNGEDRNLYVLRLALRGPDGVPAPVAGDAARWAAGRRAAQDAAERKVLGEAEAAIERIRKAPGRVRVTDAQGRPAAGVRVEAVQTTQAFLFGCNIYMFDRFPTARENDLARERFRDLFNYATVGFYWRWYEHERGRPDYAYTDRVVAWCRTNGIAMKGHPLLWNNESGTPPWVQGRPEAELMRARVAAIVGRYKDAIRTWEVVNEPSHLPGLDIAEPYRWARAADPAAHLIVNDYHVLADGCPGFLELLRRADRDGVPFDGIGIQAHEPRTMRFPLDQVRDILDRYAALGRALHITEFTPASSGDPIEGSREGDRWDEAAQADYAEKFYTVCFAHPAMRAITWWDLCDRGSWLKGGGLVRADLSPKPSYEALRRLVRGRWLTRASGVTAADGSFEFRGFHGGYEIRAAGAAPVRMTVGTNGANEVSIRLP